MIPPFDVQHVFIDPWTRDLPLFGWILLMAWMVGIPCAILGSFLILRKLALMGDAISHAVLPGLVVAFLVSGSRATGPMWLGAVVCGTLASVMVESVHRSSRVKSDAALGIVLTAMFALGVVLTSLYAGKVDLDQECVLFGEIAFVPLQPFLRLGALEVAPLPVVRMAAVAILVLVGLVVFYRLLLITSFDPALAASLYLPVRAAHYGLMMALSITIVSAFESVGAVLVVAMLILPGATAFLLVRRLKPLLLVAVAQSMLSSLLGLHLAIWLDCSMAAAMVVAGLGLFLLAWLLSPHFGLWRRWRRRTRMGPDADPTLGTAGLAPGH